MYWFTHALEIYPDSKFIAKVDFSTRRGRPTTRFGLEELVQPLTHARRAGDSRREEAIHHHVLDAEHDPSTKSALSLCRAVRRRLTFDANRALENVIQLINNTLDGLRHSVVVVQCVPAPGLCQERGLHHGGGGGGVSG